MGVIKNNNYTSEELQFARIGRALSHPVRRKIIDRLQSEIINRNIDLTQEFNLSVPSMCAHIQKLRDAGLIIEKYDTHFHEIYLNPEGFTLMVNYLNELQKKFQKFD